VARMQQGWLPVGRHVFAWDGRATDGSPVAPGVYLARARAGGLTTAARFVRVR